MVYTVNDIMQRYEVSQHTVLEWIDSGELRAVDVSRKRGGKPRWRITVQALEAFEQSRTKTPAPPPSPRRRKRQDDVIEFIN
jgi:hypothetical protein